MDVLKWAVMPLARYFDFQGRSCRKEFWFFILAYLLLSTIVGFVERDLGIDESFYGGSLMTLLLNLLVIIPFLAVTVRRFHDQNKFGWYALLYIVPGIGTVAALVFMCFEGTKGDNFYGPDPLGRVPVDTFS